MKMWKLVSKALGAYLGWSFINKILLPKVLPHWKDWCWSWNSNTLATWCKEQNHWKRPWCWERLKAGGEGVDRGWDGWMVSLTRWTWVWVSSRSWWWIGEPGMLQSMGSQRVGHDWGTELNWTELDSCMKKPYWKGWSLFDITQWLLSRKKPIFRICSKKE